MANDTDRFPILIAARELASRAGDNDIVVVDCRFNLLEPAQGREKWTDAHIPGAFYAHLDTDLASPVSATSGRHPLPTPETFAQLIGSWNVQSDTFVVAYDDAGGAIAARLWWLLRWVGHEHCALLDGGYPAWQAADLPVDDKNPTHSEGRYPVCAGSWPTIDVSGIEQGLADNNLSLLDARDPARFAGEIEPIDSKAGHVPGAYNWPFSNNLSVAGQFLPPSELAQALRPLMQGNVAAMCGSGVTACHTLFAMELAGLLEDTQPKPALYCGSWSEWIRADKRAIATGSDPFPD
jgi:thiosulfate/3-mercaptopyruvate sulfurtransferase